MKTIRRTQMEAFEGMTVESFKEDFNRKMDALAMAGKKTDKPQIDIVNLRGSVLYEEEWRELVGRMRLLPWGSEESRRTMREILEGMGARELLLK